MSNNSIKLLFLSTSADFPAFEIVNTDSNALNYRPHRPGNIICTNVEWRYINSIGDDP